jgi:uncharacterized protein (DUF488 family)
MDLYTIGFTKKSAYRFFEALRDAGVERVVDVRLNNVSQLAGFAKKQDLAYFLDKITKIQYTRRLVAEYLAAHHDGIKIHHLG